MGKGPYPELRFNITLSRKFLDPFIASLLPVLVVAGISFLLLMAGTKIKEKVTATGFKATDVLRASASLLFPLVVAQINLRGKVAASGLIYLEYFYFVVYLVIMAVAANALRFAYGDRGWAQFADNAIPKFLFWPILTGAFYALTLVFLY